MNIKQKLGKTIYNHIQKYGLTVMTNEKAEGLEQQINELKELLKELVFNPKKYTYSKWEKRVKQALK